MTQLSEFLKNSNTQGLSTRKISELAAKKGFEISNATVSRYLSGKHPEPPSLDVLKALGAVLGVPINKLEALSGMPASSAPFELPAKAATLTDSERAAILHLIDVMVANKQAPASTLSDVPSLGGPVDTAAPDFHPERAGYDLAANRDDEARARMDWLDSLGEESQDS